MRVILFRGRPGAGKTTLSTVLASRHGWKIFHKDDVYDALPIRMSHQDRNAESYSSLLQAVSEAHDTLVIDYPFQSPDQLHEFLGLLKKRGVRYDVFLVTCTDLPTWKERFANRDMPNRLIRSFEDMRMGGRR